MNRKEIINQCVEIYNNPTLSQSAKDDKILELFMAEEKSFSKAKVKRLLKQLGTKNIIVQTVILWNECRD